MPTRSPQATQQHNCMSLEIDHRNPNRPRMERAIQSRRERCRRNQREYRERQTQKVKGLEEQVRRLQEALAAQGKAPPVKPGGGTLPVQRIQNTSQDFDGEHQTPESGTHGVLQTQNSIGFRSSSELDVTRESSAAEDFPAAHGRCSPRLMYGILSVFGPDLGLDLVAPPPDIVPFLPGTPNRLAKTLFWKALEMAFRTGEDLRRQIQRGDQVDPYQFMLGLSFIIEGIGSVLSRVEFRLAYFAGRAVSTDHPGRDPEAAIRLRHQILKHMKSQGVASDEWLNAQEVEALVHHQLGPWRSALLETAVAQPKENNAGTALHTAVDKLAARAVCFGDGPRWHRGTVLSAFQEY